MSVLVPTTLAAALAAAAERPEAALLAGGTDLMVEVNEGRRTVSDVIALNRVAELRSWSHDPHTGVLRIGAGVTWREIERDPIAAFVPSLGQAARTVGSPQIRHAGTVGGNLGTCSPAGDGLPVLAALEAVVHLASSDGTRSLPIDQFMVGPKRTALQPAELITGVTVPVLHGYQGYTKVGVRNAMVIATASVALVTDLQGATVRLALGSVGPTVLRCPDAEAFAAAYISGTVTDEVAHQFGELARSAARPIDDHRSTAAYRRHSVGVLAGRLLQRAARANGALS